MEKSKEEQKILRESEMKGVEQMKRNKVTQIRKNFIRIISGYLLSKCTFNTYEMNSIIS